MKQCSAVVLQMITKDDKMNLLELNNITFSYEISEEPVLDHISLKVKKGECILIKGDNGSGKTTLFRIINGLSFPQNGSYKFEGVKIDQKYLSDNRNLKNFHKKIGYLFQNPDVMLFNGKVYDEIAFGPRQMGLSEKEVQQRVFDCMNLFHIEKLKEKAPYHLSGGQKKLVSLAAVMALNPEVLVLDEPFAYLDQKTQDLIQKFLSRLKEAGKTIILSSHMESLPDGFVDKVLKLS